MVIETLWVLLIYFGIVICQYSYGQCLSARLIPEFSVLILLSFGGKSLFLWSKDTGSISIGDGRNLSDYFGDYFLGS